MKNELLSIILLLLGIIFLDSFSFATYRNDENARRYNSISDEREIVRSRYENDRRNHQYSNGPAKMLPCPSATGCTSPAQPSTVIERERDVNIETVEHVGGGGVRGEFYPRFLPIYPYMPGQIDPGFARFPPPQQGGPMPSLFPPPPQRVYFPQPQQQWPPNYIETPYGSVEQAHSHDHQSNYLEQSYGGSTMGYRPIYSGRRY